MHISNSVPIHLMFLLPTLKHLHLLEAENMQVIVPTCSFHVNAVEGKKKRYERLCYSLDQKCVDKCTYALITILPYFKGSVNTQVHKNCCCIFELWAGGIFMVYFYPHAQCLPAFPIALGTSWDCSMHSVACSSIQIHASSVFILGSPLRLLSQK